MSIVRLCRTYPREQHPGIGLHCYNFSKYITSPTIIFTKKMHSRPIDIPSNVNLQEIGYEDLSFQKEQENPLRLIFIILSKLMGEFVFSIKTLLFLKKNKVQVDIVHLHSINYLLTAYLIKIFFKAPMVMNFGGTDLVRLKHYKFLEWFAKKSSKVFYVAKSMENDLLDIFSHEQLVHISNGVDIQQFKPQNKVRKRQFIAVGNLRWQKGYPYLIDAFKQVVDVDDTWQLLIVGEGEDKHKIEQQIYDCNLQQNVSLLGTKDRDAIVDLMNTSHAFVMSSVSEGFPKVLIESIGCATPVVVTDVGECRFVADGVGITVNSRSSDELSNAMLKIINDADAWQEYSNHCLKVREQFDWKFMVGRVESAYADILNS